MHMQNILYRAQDGLFTFETSGNFYDKDGNQFDKHRLYSIQPECKLPKSRVEGWI